MQHAEPLIEAISQRLESFVQERRTEAEAFGDEALLMVDHAAAALRGGKRLRARLCAAGWRAAGGPDVDPAPEHLIAAASALEIFQAAALVHDDLIDNADTRRGRPSGHRALEAAHAGAAWRGDAEAFGRSAALLVGDLLVAWSDDLLEWALERSPATAATARSEYALMRREVTMGQFLDIAEESAWSTADEAELAERALRIASLKSARYSVQQPLVIGAALAGADAEQLEALRRIGHPLGMAFQLRDDVLGVFGDARETGKPAGDDLREGKRTVLVALARTALAADARRVFDTQVGAPGLDERQVEELAGIIRDTGALERVERMIDDYTDEADRAMAASPFDDAAIDALRELARAATRRTA